MVQMLVVFVFHTLNDTMIQKLHVTCVIGVNSKPKHAIVSNKFLACHYYLKAQQLLAKYTVIKCVYCGYFYMSNSLCI